MATNDRGSLQRVDQETVSSENLGNAAENTSKTRIDATRNRPQLKDGGNTPLGGFAREVAGVC